MRSGFDLKKTPLAVTWETTLACDPAHEVQQAPGERHPLELNTEQAEKLIADVAELCPPIFGFAGGDPLRRPDIYQLIASAAFKSLHPVLAVNASSLSAEAVLEMKKAGLSRLALNIDGPTEEIHDQLLGLPGSFARTLSAMYWADRCWLPIQVSTTVSRRNMNDLENILHVIKSFRLTLWNLCFPIPANRDQAADVLSPVECERVFARIYKMSQEVQFKIKTTEAQHYRRYVLQQRARTRGQTKGGMSEGIPGILPINEAHASIFISYTGEVFPGARLPLSAGNIRDTRLAEIYRNSELFRKFRDTNNLEGKCGDCECREICGGSRARVYALTGELFGEDPCCIYQPKRVKPAMVTPGADVEGGSKASSQ
jgi:radical SAM protein with 4Fe4S-binding SPASM domain